MQNGTSARRRLGHHVGVTDEGATEEWFHSDSSAPFIEQVRGLADEFLAGLVEPGATWAMTGFGDALICVTVPEIPDEKNPATIQVMWDRGSLGGYWGDAYLFDDWDANDPEALVVRGIELDEVRAASLTLSWLAEQLRRPVELREWRKGDRVVAQRWLLADTGSVIRQRGSWVARRGPVSAVINLRPKPTT